MSEKTRVRVLCWPWHPPLRPRSPVNPDGFEPGRDRSVASDFLCFDATILMSARVAERGFYEYTVTLKGNRTGAMVECSGGVWMFTLMRAFAKALKLRMLPIKKTVA